ncbi:poly-gamma-glutamate biosynthesis protein PgsC [Dehalobacterium formicoaceticum]|uniref:Poly-gamma-glutamate biosynthesis protein PgsC n=1 Tax=Dehalobacterium formicoaceticum TaxID=51515 RepID=A0ABT1Y3N0_9FIRM|nr:poly-gamma-glutamate biosynthesis protein PgsC [Dehalobacterium formicoaceticum]MCR6544524.1 poly-gamma-glutamate biosynthesis protein PgsC [Dehalobacterium formicoaceticum]
MLVTEIGTILILGVIFSLLFTEISGILPAGLIVPGYLVLLINSPQAILLTLLISLLTYLVVDLGVSKVTILYGKRKFVAMITVAIVLQFILYATLPLEYRYISGLAAVGIVVPGLIANTIQRQGVATTLMSTGLLCAVTYAGTLLLNIKV